MPKDIISLTFCNSSLYAASELYMVIQNPDRRNKPESFHGISNVVKLVVSLLILYFRKMSRKILFVLQVKTILVKAVQPHSMNPPRKLLSLFQ
jgi:hypothetical protein